MHSTKSGDIRLVFITIVVVIGMALSVRLIYSQINVSIKLSDQSALGLKALGYLDNLNSSFTFIERNEKPYLIVKNRGAVSEINEGFKMANSSLDSLNHKDFRQVINQNLLDSINEILKKKKQLSNELIRLSLLNKPDEAVAVLSKSNDSALIQSFYLHYNKISNTLKSNISFQQERHLNQTQRVYEILSSIIFLVLALLLFSIFKLIKHIRLKNALLFENKTFADIINFSSDSILIHDKDFNITYGNKATEDLFGFKIQDIIGKDPDTQFSTYASPEFIHERRMAIRKYGFWMGELKRKDVDGKILDLHITLNSFKDLKGNSKGYFSISSDITKLAKAQNEIKNLADSLAEVNQHLQDQVASQTVLIKDVFERVHEVFIGTDSNFKINYASKHIDTIFGMSSESLIGMSIKDFLLEIADPGYVEIPKTAFDSNQNICFEFNHWKTGYWFEGNVYPSKNGISIYFKDITEKVKSEAEILKSQKMYEFISKASEQILLAKNADDLFTNICEVAVSFEDFLFCWIGAPDQDTENLVAIKWAGKEDGYLSAINSISTKDSPEGRGPSGRAFREGKYYYSNDIATDPAMGIWREQALKRGYRSSISLPIRIDNKVTHIFTLYTSKSYFFTEEQIDLLVKITENISFVLHAFNVADLKKVSEMELLKVLKAIEQSSASIVISDVKGDIEYVNPAFTKLTGYSFAEAIGQNPRILKTGHTSDKEYENLWTKITHHAEWSGEFCNKKKNGELYWEYAVISPVLNDVGEVTNYVAVKENITARKILEDDQKRLTTDLFKRNHDLEQFSYILSHNIRGPLSNILGLKNALMRNTANTLEPGLLQAISVSAETMDQVIKEVTQIIHTKKLSLEVKNEVDFEKLVNSVKDNINHFLIEKRAVIETDFSKMPTCYSLESYLNSIFYHLIVNALKFSKPEIPPKIHIWTESAPGKIIIHFKDFGIGIDLHRFGKTIFNLYKRFTLNVEGRGIGLYLVKSQVEFLGGDIELKSEPNEWTEFIIILPNEQQVNS
jgi:PAS domain S-box-containing protein